MHIKIMTRAEFKAHLAQTVSIQVAYYQTAAGTLKIQSTALGMFQAQFVEDGSTIDALLHDDILHQQSLLLVGTDFQVSVWKAVLAIPAGQTTSYASIARMLGRPNSYRAVANAVGDNALAYFVPCHRVICTNGDQGGYAWGLARKAQLLESESYTSSV